MSNGLTLGAMRSEVREYLLNTDANSLVWTDAEINGYLNEGTFYIQQLSSSLWDMGVVPVVANQADYNAPDNQYQFVRLTWDRQFLPQTNEYELDRDTVSAWRGDPPGSPARFYLKQHNVVSLYPKPNITGLAYTASPNELGEIQYFTLSDGTTVDSGFSFSQSLGIVTRIVDPSGGTIITLWPDPSNRFTDPELGIVIDYVPDSGNLAFMYIAQPDTMTDDAHSPQFQETFHPAVVYYTMMRCFLRDGEFQDLQAGMAWYQTFLDWMDAALAAGAKEFPTMVKSAEPYGVGNILNGRLQAVGPPSQLFVLGAP